MKKDGSSGGTYESLSLFFEIMVLISGGFW
jgi:hypothetical protein